MKRIHRSHPILLLLIIGLTLLFQQVVSISGGKESSSDILLSNNTSSYSGMIKVTRVIDGDTVVLSDGTKLRYIGVNSPETHKHECFSSEAKKKMKNWYWAKKLFLRKMFQKLININGFFAMSIFPMERL